MRIVSFILSVILPLHLHLKTLKQIGGLSLKNLQVKIFFAEIIKGLLGYLMYTTFIYYK